MTTMAGERGLRTLDLTSRPSRESALRLYEGVGFRRRETNILRYTPDLRRSPVQGPARYDRAFAVWGPLSGMWPKSRRARIVRGPEMVSCTRPSFAFTDQGRLG